MKPHFWLALVFLLGCLLTAVSLTPTNEPPQQATTVPDLGMSSFGSPKILDPASLGESWRQFRGGGASGISKRADLPVEWSGQKNLLWQTELPGRGASTPITCMQRVYVTSSSGYGESFANTGETRYLKHHVSCLDAQTGGKIWSTSIAGSPLTQSLNHEVLAHGFASSTPVTDGTNVYAFFGASGVHKFSSRGKLIWSKDVGLENNRYGSAASLAIYEKWLIVNASAESESVIAIDTQTGRGAWRINDVKNSWSTPVLAKNNRGETVLIIQDEGRVRGFDPANGKQIWQFNGPKGYASSTPTAVHGCCYFLAGPTRTLTAFQIDGRGNITESNKLWSVNNVARHTSPVYLTGNVFTLSESGIVKCFDGRDGTLLKAKRIPVEGRVYASPTLMGPNLYLPSGTNRVYVCRANANLDIYRENTIDDQTVLASLCPSSNSLLVRSDNKITCVLPDRNEETFQNKIAQSSRTRPTFQRYEMDTNGQRRNFVNLLSRDPEVLTESLLQPIREQLGYRQQQDAKQWVLSHQAALEELRQSHRDIYWQQLIAGNANTDEHLTQLKHLEQATLAEATRLRDELLSILRQENGSIALKK